MNCPNVDFDQLETPSFEVAATIIGDLLKETQPPLSPHSTGTFPVTVLSKKNWKIADIFKTFHIRKEDGEKKKKEP